MNKNFNIKKNDFRVAARYYFPAITNQKRNRRELLTRQVMNVKTREEKKMRISVAWTLRIGKGIIILSGAQTTKRKKTK